MSQYLNSRTLYLLISLIGGLLFWQLMGFLSAQFGSPAALRIWGGSGAGFVKLLAYVGFLYAMLDLWEKRKTLRREMTGFNLGLLPQQDQMVLTPEDVANIKLAVLAREKNGEPRYLVATYIKKAATQFRNDNSVSDTMKVLEMQIESDKHDEEARLEVVRYIIQTIPMLGFVGSIIQLTASFQSLEKGLNLVQETLHGAFDATLVALLLTIALSFFYHTYLGQMDRFYARVKSYIVDNLISRIYNPKR